MAIGSVAALLGLAIAVGVGAVPTPLSDTTNAPKAVTLAATPTVSVPTPSASYAIAKVPASPAAHHAKASPSPSHSPSAKAKPTHPAVSVSASPSVTPSTATPTPTHAPATPTATPSATSSPGLLVPTATAEYQSPKGSNQLAWSEAILTAMGDPLTTANLVSMGYWMQNEAGAPPYGICGANNPINVSEPGYGGTPIQNEGGGYYLYSYPNVAEGVAAIAAYLNRPNYDGILADLKNGVGLADPSIASELEVYSGDSYGQIPDSWGASQGAPDS
jgi:hypothetical protein